MLQGANDWNGGLKAACYDGQLAMVKWLIAKGAHDWNGGLKAAREGDHAELIKLMTYLSRN
jgi:hypothetical protein